MFLSALIPALVYYAGLLINGFIGGMFNRPIVIGTLTGLLLGDLTTGAIVGAQMEIMYLGIVSVGGVMATDAAFATCFGTALAITHGMPWEAAVAIAIPAGLIGNLISQINMMIKALAIPLYDRLIQEDKMGAFQAAYLGVPVVINLIAPVAIFAGLFLGADVLSNVVNSMPEWVTVGMSAAGAMLPAVGMGVLLNYLWNPRLVIYLIVGFAVVAFLKVPTMFMAIIAVFLAFIDFSRTQELSKLKVAKAVAAPGDENLSDEEDFFDE